MSKSISSRTPRSYAKEFLALEKFKSQPRPVKASLQNERAPAYHSDLDDEKQMVRRHDLLSNSAATLSEFLVQNPAIEFIRYQWVDYSGVLRTRILPKNYCTSLVASNNPMLGAPFAHTVSVSNTIFEHLAIGINKLFPDWTSLCRFHTGKFANRYGSVMCWTNEPNGSDEDSACTRCPRTATRNVLKRAKDSFGLDILIGFEVEFMLTRCIAADGVQHQLLQKGLWVACFYRTEAFACLEECVTALQSVGVSRGYSGQLEVSLGPLPPMEAIDTLILAHEVIQNVAFEYNHGATMYPKPFAEHPANVAHTHLSIHPPQLEDHFWQAYLIRYQCFVRS